MFIKRELSYLQYAEER